MDSVSPMGLVGLTVTAFMTLVVMVSSNDGACPASQVVSMVQMKQNVEKKPDDEDKIVTALVSYVDSEGKAAADAEDLNGHHEDMPHLHVEAVKVNKSGFEKLLQQVGNGHIKSVEEDATILSVAVHHMGKVISGLDREEHTPYGINMVNVENVPQGPWKVKVCVVDTGYGLGHPDLPTAEHGVTGMTPEDDYYAGESWDVDGHGHGTHCAGTIGAIGGNGEGVTSVNPDPTKFSFRIGKGLTDSGRGTGAGVLLAVDGCIDAGANVISMSLGGGGPSLTTADAYKNAYENDGVLIIAAAGNGGNSVKGYPASYPHVMSVAAVDRHKRKASFSQYNDQVEIAAPGVDVESPITTNDGDDFDYASWSGTSMATPHVAGVAARVWSNFPNCTNQQIRNVLVHTAEDQGLTGCDRQYGYGIVNGSAAYELLLAEGCQAGDLSHGATGGCTQIPGPPTPAPTPAPTCANTCDSRPFELKFKTDRYPAETTWELKDAAGDLVAQGNGPYEKNTEYDKTLCLGSGSYTFTIKDEVGDGTCCGYGDGWYTVTVEGIHVPHGDTFNNGNSENLVIDACSTTEAPTPSTNDAP